MPETPPILYPHRSQRISLFWLLSVGLGLLGVGLSGWMPILAWISAGILLTAGLWRWLPPLVGQWQRMQEDKIQLERLTGFLALVALVVALVILFQLLGGSAWLALRVEGLGWEAVGALGEVIGALGQISIAVVAAFIAWRQYVISRDLTLQQNQITQQQTIDTYFQGISDLVLDPQGQLEDWPLERAIAQGRTAAILTGLDPVGKAKILRFLSIANLLSPLRRDQHLGRPILDGKGGYQRDRQHGIRVIDLKTFLEGADLHGTDLRGVDLSEFSLEGANLQGCDLSYANLTGANLQGANLRGATLHKALLFIGPVETATPARPKLTPNFKTGEGSGAIVKSCLLTGVQELSEDQRRYLCAWGGAYTRSTLPGHCQDCVDLSQQSHPLLVSELDGSEID